MTAKAEIESDALSMSRSGKDVECDADLLWRRAEAWYEANPDLSEEDIAWIEQGQRLGG